MNDREQEPRNTIFSFKGMSVFGLIVLGLTLIGWTMALVGFSTFRGGLAIFGLVLGIIPLMIYGAIRIDSLSKDNKWARSLARREVEGGMVTMEEVPDGVDVPGICSACGGTLFYGRLHCPHCSESIFNMTEDASSPPEM